MLLYKLLILLIFIVILFSILYINNHTNNQIIEIPFHIPAKIIPDYKQRIPFSIYQTFKSRKITKRDYNRIMNTIKLNPEYDYYFYGDNECIDFLQKHFGDDYVKAFHSLVPGAFKADFWRYAILYKLGGIYIDLDVRLYEPLRYYCTDINFISVKDVTLNGIYQAFLGCTQYNPVMKLTLEKCLYNIQTKFYGEHELEVTGPLLLSKCYNIGCNKNDNIVIQDGDEKLEWGDSRILKAHHFLITYKGLYLLPSVYKNKILLTGKDSILDNNSTLHYTLLWMNKKIYK